MEISSGRVLLSVNSSKTLFSYGLNGGFVRYLSYSKLLETEAGFTVNEPSQLAVHQAIETAVYSLIMEGNLKHLWGFKDEVAGQKAVAEYLKRRDGGSTSDILKQFAPSQADDAKIVATVQKPAAPVDVKVLPASRYQERNPLPIQ